MFAASLDKKEKKFFRSNMIINWYSVLSLIIDFHFTHLLLLFSFSDHITCQTKKGNKKKRKDPFENRVSQNLSNIFVAIFGYKVLTCYKFDSN